MDALRKNNGLSLFSREIEKALFDSEILRNHLTIEVRTPNSWKQEYNVVYRNKRKKNDPENDSLTCIRLPPRRKKVQRTLSIYDKSGQQLTIIPSELVNKALINVCEFYLSEVINSFKDKKYFDELMHHVDFCSVFSYNSNMELVQKILHKLKKVISELESKLEYSEDTYLLYLRRIYFLVNTYKNFYIPIAKLEEPLNPRDCVFIRYLVENLTKPFMSSDTSMSNRTLYFKGYLNLSFPLELETGASNHFRIMSPPGMIFRNAGISGLEGVLNLEMYADLDELLDDDVVCFHIPQEKAKEILKLQKKRIIEGKDKMKIKISLGVDKNIFRRFSLTRSLVFLMYLSAIIPLWAFLFPYQDFVFGFQVTSISVLITLAILVSLAVYSMDKRFLHDYLAGQVVILITVYLAELLFIVPFW